MTDVSMTPRGVVCGIPRKISESSTISNEECIDGETRRKLI